MFFIILIGIFFLQITGNSLCVLDSLISPIALPQYFYHRVEFSLGFGISIIPGTVICNRFAVQLRLFDFLFNYFVKNKYLNSVVSVMSVLSLFKLIISPGWAKWLGFIMVLSNYCYRTKSFCLQSYKRRTRNVFIPYHNNSTCL